MWFEEEESRYEQMYSDWVQSNCKCDLEECACKGFDEWLYSYEEEQAQDAYDRYLEEQCLMAE